MLSTTDTHSRVEDSISFFASRNFFDKAYNMAAGYCLQDKNDTIGTRACKYTIAVIGLYFVLALMIQRSDIISHLSPKTSLRQLAFVFHFAFVALSFILEAVYYQTADTAGGNDDEYDDDDGISSFTVRRFGYFFLQLTLPCLIFAMIPSLYFDFYKRIVVLINFILGAVFVLIVGRGLIFTVAIYVLLSIYFLFTYIYKLRKHGKEMKLRHCSDMFLWVIAPLLPIIGLSIFYFLIQSCGSEETYKNCFEDCILRGYRFNYNFIFHVIWALMELSYGVGAYQLPYSSLVVEEEEEMAGSAAGPTMDNKQAMKIKESSANKNDSGDKVKQKIEQEKEKNCHDNKMV